MYSTIERTKFGNCSQCLATNTNVVKRGHDLFCLSCARNNKAKDQLQKSYLRQKVRNLANGHTKADTDLLNDSVEKEKWFRLIRKKLVGRCIFCGGKTEKYNDKTFRSSIAHLLPKKNNFGGFPSVATHEDNWLELCYYGNSCHDNFDRRMITLEILRDSKEWDIIVTKFKKIYPYIAISERRNIPVLLLKEIENGI